MHRWCRRICIIYDLLSFCIAEGKTNFKQVLTFLSEDLPQWNWATQYGSYSQHALCWISSLLICTLSLFSKVHPLVSPIYILLYEICTPHLSSSQQGTQFFTWTNDILEHLRTWRLWQYPMGDTSVYLLNDLKYMYMYIQEVEYLLSFLSWLLFSDTMLSLLWLWKTISTEHLLQAFLSLLATMPVFICSVSKTLDNSSQDSWTVVRVEIWCIMISPYEFSFKKPKCEPNCHIS